jgi:DeoR/GlpR family transcriptional regulator of sugar metabolism
MQEEITISSVERQEQIYSIIENEKRISVSQICKSFGVSEATARRDLETLADKAGSSVCMGEQSAFGRHHLKDRSLKEAWSRQRRKRDWASCSNTYQRWRNYVSW